MEPRERVFKALEHVEPDMIPFWGGFSSIEAQARFFGERYHEANAVEKTVFTSRLFNSDIANLPTAGFPGGPGIFEQVVLDEVDHIIARNPFGGLQYWRKSPYFAKPLYSPVKRKTDLAYLEPVDLEAFKPKIRQLARDAAALKELGYFMMTEIKGAFETPWMYLRGLEQYLKDVASDPGFASKLTEAAFKPLMELTEMVLDEAPFDAVWMTEDLGETRSPLFKPEKYRTLYKPWHEEVARRIHRKHAKAFLHSHGNVMPLFKDLVDAGFDSIDPLDPADNMDLARLKTGFGEKVTLMGGITRDIGVMSAEQLQKHIEDRARIGQPGGGYILMCAGGVPPEMSLGNFNLYLRSIEKYRRLKACGEPAVRA